MNKNVIFPREKANYFFENLSSFQKENYDIKNLIEFCSFFSYYPILSRKEYIEEVHLKKYKKKIFDPSLSVKNQFFKNSLKKYEKINNRRL